MKFSIKNYINEHSKTLSQLDQKQLNKIIELIYRSHVKGKKIFTCGNGGSASTASHMIKEWNKMTTSATKKNYMDFHSLTILELLQHTQTIRTTKIFLKVNCSQLWIRVIY